ncbi:MAG: type II toxin-antitoxin system RelE/ParE family toxin [Deltaproteobacteria bacterium]|nr:type II toxin-antitoxin system RelE/ParE family toxin [Deltaproteobacteria bacterium]MBW1833392.1 type II toxin-antitoxin system RelE/ParE family toxin [Deltaproteobacteria bacterium]MBW2165260.1 type II toxin-antitoxin system RelE/ParE family toxin [Deltaproteobacteria bacterium]
MNQTYEIIWAVVAENDLKEIIEYIATDSPANALKVLKRIKQKASSLYTLPERGRIVPELQDQGILLYRELIIPPWRIIYRISEIKVYVLSVLDARQNVEDMLLKRLILTEP